MQIKGKLTEADVNDAQRLVRSKTYWLKLAAANWYGLLLLGAILWATVAGVAGASHPNWTGLAGVWVVIAGIVAWSLYRTKRTTAKEMAALDAERPDWIGLEHPGVTLHGPKGATAFQPWNSFTRWREGKRVLLLEMQAGRFIIVSVAELPEIERQSIRQLLDLYIVSAHPNTTDRPPSSSQ
jgi:YcxB-like protein